MSASTGIPRLAWQWATSPIVGGGVPHGGCRRARGRARAGRRQGRADQQVSRGPREGSGTWGEMTSLPDARPGHPDFGAAVQKATILGAIWSQNRACGDMYWCGDRTRGQRQRRSAGRTADGHGRGGGRDAGDFADVGVRVRVEERDPHGAARTAVGGPAHPARRDAGRRPLGDDAPPVHECTWAIRGDRARFFTNARTDPSLELVFRESRVRDSNSRPHDYKSSALPTELTRRPGRMLRTARPAETVGNRSATTPTVEPMHFVVPSPSHTMTR
jgi:hypothetical protein